MWTASGQNEFQNLLSSLRRTKSCKKELWAKITAAVQNPTIPGLNSQQQWYLFYHTVCPEFDMQMNISCIILHKETICFFIFQKSILEICSCLSSSVLNVEIMWWDISEIWLICYFTFKFLILYAAVQYCARWFFIVKENVIMIIRTAAALW